MHLLQSEPLLWLRPQTITNQLAAFCPKRERCLIISLYFTPALFEADITLKWSSFVVWWRSHLVTGLDWSRCWQRSSTGHLLWENPRTPFQTGESQGTTLSWALHGICRWTCTLEEKTLLCLEERDVVWCLLHFHSMLTICCMSFCELMNTAVCVTYHRRRWRPIFSWGHRNRSQSVSPPWCPGSPGGSLVWCPDGRHRCHSKLLAAWTTCRITCRVVRVPPWSSMKLSKSMQGKGRSMTMM